jgi:hypothetical protein
MPLLGPVLGLLLPTATPSVVPGRLYRHGLRETTGSPWLDEPGDDEVVVRLSSAAGLPTGMPDVHELAVRVLRGDGRDGYGDLLFTQRGRGRLSRFQLLAGRTAGDRPMATLPYRTPSGAVLLGARMTGAESFELSCAPYDGKWRHLADLRIATLPADDQDLSFDPVRHQLPGLEQHDAVAGVQEE